MAFEALEEIKKVEKESGKDYTGIISKGLSSILQLKEETIYKKIKNELLARL